MDVEALGFQCGGAKGLAYAGALTQLEFYGMDISKIKHFAGTGTGAQIAALLAFGYTPSELERVLKKHGNAKQIDTNWGVIRKSYRLMTTFGSFSNKRVKRHIDALLTEKSGHSDTSFLQLWNKRKVHLRITGTCLTTGELVYFDYKLTPNMPIRTAIHISGATPFQSEAVEYQDKYYVDGGLICNIPMDVFESKNTVFLELREPDVKQRNEIHNILQFAYSVVNTTSSHCNRLMDANATLRNHTNVKIIPIAAPSIASMKKTLDAQTKLHLVQQGRHAVSYYMQRRLIQRLIRTDSVEREEYGEAADMIPQHSEPIVRARQMAAPEPKPKPKPKPIWKHLVGVMMVAGFVFVKTRHRPRRAQCVFK